MKNELQPEIKIKLFASLIHNIFMKQHPHSDLMSAVWNLELQTHITSHSSLHRLGVSSSARLA
jgi:hypothetical protein